MKTLIYITQVYTKHLGYKVYILLIFSIVIAIIDGFGITMILPILEGIDSNSSDSRLPNFIRSVMQFFRIPHSINGVLGFMFILFLLKGIVKMWSGYFQSNLYKDLYRRLKVKLFEGIMNLKYSYFSMKNSGHFVTVINDHVNRMISSFNIFIAVITTIFMSSYYIILAANLSWRISLISAGLGGVAVFALSKVSRRVKKMSKSIAHKEKENSQNVIQAIGAYKYLVATNSYQSLKGIYQKSVEGITRLHFKTQVSNSFSRSSREIITVSLLILLIYIETQIFGNPLSSMILILILFYRAVNQLMFIQNNYQLLIASLGMIESVDKEFYSLKDNEQTQGGLSLEVDDFKNSILLKKLQFSFGSQSNFNLFIENLEIKPNSVFAIVGPSGSGKSTLVDILMGIHLPTQGSISINHKTWSKINLNSLRSHIGYVSQEVALFDDTLLNNITLFESNPNMDLVISSCKQANIWDFVSSLEYGLETPIGERGIRISGGQRQRLSIARELYKKPRLLILDEATSALDVESEMIIKEAIDRLHGTLTVIVIAHRLVTIKSADYIMVMDGGRIIETGSFDYLSSDAHSRFYTMLNAQKI